jgi:hypothetical protein
MVSTLIPLHRLSPSPIRGFTTFVNLQASTKVWHHCVGHPAMPIIHHVIHHHKLPISGSNDKSPFCEPFQMAKSKRLPFHKSTRESSSPLQLVHSDVWQSPVVSLSSYCYYVIFIDDYSQFSWPFPLKLKSNVHSCFLQFKCMVEKLVSKPIKSFQSDGGGEYSYNPFKNVLAQHFILHRYSCPHTSQQNGVTECKHHHVEDTGLALLAHSGLSTKYWVDAFLTVVYLINRLPTPTLSHLTPYFKLFQRFPDYHLLRSFGCTYYPLLHPYKQHKLNFRSKKCVFLSYSPHHHGYRCLDLSTNRVYIFRDVVFNEQEFPAKTMLSLPVPLESNNPSESIHVPLPTPPGNSLNPSSLSTPFFAVPATHNTDLNASPHQATPPPSPPHIPIPPHAPSLPIAPSLIPPTTTRMVTHSMTGTSRLKLSMTTISITLHFTLLKPFMLIPFHQSPLPTLKLSKFLNGTLP